MGNDSSKQTIENQQMILQLQQQLMQQRQTPSQHPYPRSAPAAPRLPVISPAELLQRTPHPNRDFNQEEPPTNRNRPHRSLLDILHDKVLMAEIDKNPNTKRKFLERLLGEHRHVMTTQQVQRITAILESLPPADNGYAPGNHSIYNQNHAPIHAAGGFNEGTTRQDSHGKELQRQEQVDTIDALTRHYKTEAEREEAEFKQEEARRRREFLEKQRRRRTEYQYKLSDLEKNNVDALRLFNLTERYSLDDLKMAYKKLAMKTHPDKPTGNAEQFQLVTKCYLSLLEKYKARESDRPFNELKTGSQVYLEDQSKSRMMNKQFHSPKVNAGNGAGTVVDKEKFDLKLFNKIYEQNKLWDSNDDGYGNWFSSDTGEEAPTELFGNKFNLNVFNSTFEDYKERLTAQSGAIQEYHEPQELVSCATGFTDLDQDVRKVEDFSKPSSITPTGAGGKSNRDLGYTDLKTAYTSRGAFIDPNKVEYKTYKNVDELKRDRGNVRFDMNPEEMRAYQLKQHRQEEEEARRQAIIHDRDNQITNTYSRTHERMLGYHGTAPS